MPAISEANREAQATWNNRACGQRDDFDLRYKTIAARRYGEDDTWVPGVLDFPSMRGKHVLEIGHGMGCDLTTAALNGAVAYGIDLTPNHHEIAKRTLDDAGVSAELHLGNAGELPFESESIDIVYSLGVLHHTDNIEQCISEAHRVLRPGGTFIMSLYHFWSVHHLWLMVLSTKNGNLRRLGYRNLLSTVEAGADGVNIKPLVRLNSQRSTRKLLANFSRAETKICGNTHRIITTLLPRTAADQIEKHWGWYVVARCTK
jgi:ubiquinone/menaquinone biosynthesis C-methylase UbiE